MRTIGATTQLIDLLNSGTDFVMADLYTITIPGGTILRYTSADIPLSFGGNTWLKGPTFTRDKITHKIGLEAAEMTVEIDAEPTDLVNGVGFIAFVAGLGLDGATIKLERAFLASWDAPVTVVGTLIDFAGKITSIRDITRLSMSLTAQSWTVLLNVLMPPDLYQTACLNTLYDANCTMNPATFSAASTVTAFGGNTERTFRTGLTGATGLYDQGRIVFTSGPNSGLTRAVQSYSNTNGQVTVVGQFPSVPAGGNAFTIYQGCDLTLNTCVNKFNNRLHFRGTPFVPPVTSAM